MRPAKNKNEEDNNSLSVFGYSSRLFEQSELDGRNEDNFLIPWQDDDKLLIDRAEPVLNKYDCRVFLPDLSEKTIGTTTSLDNEEVVDKIEEELCDEERYKDLKIAEDAREKAEAVEKQNRGKGAEFAFSYDTNDETADDGLSGESDEEDTEVYEPPEGLKLPVGINLPPTAKMGHIIERTANFVALQGNQMEIIIKVKHRDHKDRFGFLDFDNPLNSFYKYICKLIREKKYVPKPPKKKLLPGEHTVQQRPENFDSDGEEDSDDGDYLHPLLLASKAKTISTAPVAPVPVPVSSTKNNPYSSLYGSLYGIDQNETQEDESPKEKEQTPPKEEVKQPEQIPVETDAMEIHNYNIWHQWFYSRPSIFLPNPPIKPKTPPADLLSQINVAAKFVAANGAYSERNLLEHNRGRLNFLYPNSEYLVYYHCKLRFFQARLNPRVMPCVYSKYHRQFELEIPLQTYQPAPPPPETKQQETKASVDQLPTSTSVNIPEAPTPPETIQISEFPITNFESDDSEDIKRKRRERAQQFMNDIIKTKKSGSSREKPQNEKPRKKEDVVVPADIAIPNLITSLVTGQLEKLKPVSKEPSEPPTRSEEGRKEKKRRRSRSRSSKRRSKSRDRSRRSRSPRSRKSRRRRSPSYDNNSDRKRRRRRSRSKSRSRS